MAPDSAAPMCCGSVTTAWLPAHRTGHGPSGTAAPGAFVKTSARPNGGAGQRETGLTHC